MQVLGRQDLDARLHHVECPAHVLAQRAQYARSYVQSVGATIAGGTSEIQRNIIAQRGLGMPREPSPAKV